MVKLFLKFSLGSWLSAAISLFTTPIVTALILPDEFGKASMYTLAFNLLLQLALLGTDQSFVRKFYQKGGEGYPSKLLVNSIGVPLLFSLVICAFLFLFGQPVARWLVGNYSTEFILLLTFSLLTGVVERYAMLMLRMQKQAVTFSVLRVILSLVNFFVIFLYATAVQKNFYAIIYGNVISLTLCTLIAILLTRKQWKLASIEYKLVGEILRYGFPFLPTFLVLWVFEGIDKMALRQYSNFYEIGLFSAAFKIVAILSILQTAFSTFWTPVAFEMYEKNSGEAQQTFSKVFSYMSAILFICGIGMVLIKDLIIWLFDKSYHEASSIMPFLLLVPIMYTLSEVTVGGINYKNKTYWHLIIAFGAAATNYALNMFLVPEYGAKGAAISTGISYLVFFYSRTLISNSFYHININFTKLNLGAIIFLGVSFVNSFYPKETFSYLLTAGTLILMVFLYRAELQFFQKALIRRIAPSLVVNK